MILPDIDFTRIRPLDGTRHTGFEELCSQLASLENESPGAVFTRKGRGGDAGLECFFKLPSGEEVGWQAKYIFEWDASLGSQLDKSVEAALEKHPCLSRFVVCLPFDLPDSRPKPGKRGRPPKSARKKWEDWKDKWEKKANSQKRSLTISLWGKSELLSKLTIDKPAQTGRLLYWFDQETLTTQWLIEQFGKAKDALGSRYTPETNVELPIRRDFLAFARDPFLETTVQEWALSLPEKGASTLRSLERANGGSSATEITELSEALNELNDALRTDPIGPEALYPVERWKDAVADCYAAVRRALSWVYTLPEEEKKHGTTDQGWARHNLFDFGNILTEIQEALDSNQWALANAHAVLLTGAAGSGKSHLLADVVEHQVNLGRPALVVLGSAMIEGDPWRQIMTQLDLPSDLQAKQFLGMLDAAAQAAEVRALVCVDAMNERHGPEIWPERMAAFLKAAEPFPRVGIVLSCRSTYVRHVVPDTLGEHQLNSIKHEGFGGRGGEAANVYLAKRGIVRPGAPNLVPEFLNPLFLKTCCDFLDFEGKNELPRGLRGVSAIFEFYNNAVVRAVTKRMRLDPHLEVVERALKRFADLIVSDGVGYASKSDAIAAFDEILPPSGSLERSLLAQFESEGVIALEPVRQDNGSFVKMVRFTFERYSDHAIAKRLLDEHLDPSNPHASFANGTRLGEVAFGSRNYRFAGIIEALAIQLPETVQIEIADFRTEIDWTVENAFQESLLWRDQAFFSDRTLELVHRFNDEDGVRDVLVSVATEPGNKFNADYLHEQLKKLTMPDRDFEWSIYVNARGDESDPLGQLISWAMQNGMGAVEDERARLAATALGWLLTSSNRMIRDRATKALGCLFAERLDLTSSVLRLFADVDDLYVQERLFAAAYGAALQGKETHGLTDLALTAYELIFESGTPPCNELLRDHARGIVAYSDWRGVLPTSVDIALTLPPYQSSWPIEYVPDALIDTYKQDYDGQLFYDAIVSSVGEHGDFASYVVRHKVDRWSPSLLSATECPSSAKLAEDWIGKFRSSATTEQLEAFEALLTAAKAAKGELSYKKSPEKLALESAELAFQGALSAAEWEEYRVEAKHYIRQWKFAERSHDYSARFDEGWARRWICKRAHELGWTAEKFAAIERNSSSDRHDHRVERIGKKYQWLALGELIARMADNLMFMGQGYGDEGPRPYTGAREIGLRDMDPSLLVTKTHYDGWKQWPRTWWVPVEPRLRQIEPMDRLVWLEGESDLLNDPALIDLTDPKTSRKWLPLDAFAQWRQYGIDGTSREMQRETWYRVNCIVMAKEDEAQVARSLKGRILANSHDIPKFHLDSEYYLGEFPWCPGIKEADDWVKPNSWNDFGAPVRGTTAEYYHERGGYDYSIDETIRVKLPAPWLAEALDLSLFDGRQPRFVDPSGETRFFDPSVSEPGHAAALVDRDKFLSMLRRENLSAVWIISGEKGVFGGRDPHRGYGGRICHTAIYRMDANGFSREFHSEREYPIEEQLESFLGSQPPPEISKAYSRPHVPPPSVEKNLAIDDIDLGDLYRKLIEGE
jgi:hypothetical protein